MDADAVTQLHESAELVDGEYMLHPIREMLGDVTRVFAECLRGLARFPSTDTILERLRQVPVIECGERFDAVGEQLVDEAFVEVEPLGIGRATALREDARPRDRKSIRLDAERFHELDVALVAMV